MARRTQLHSLITLIITLTFAVGCTSVREFLAAQSPSAVPTNTDTPPAGPPQVVYAGAVASGDIDRPYPSAAGWETTARALSGAFGDARPLLLWTVATSDSYGAVSLQFRGDGHAYAEVTPSYYDKHFGFLDYYDAHGVDVLLKIEPGAADVDSLIDLTLREYHQHPSVVGIALDLDHYRPRLAAPVVDDALAEAWQAKVQSYHPRYRLALVASQRGQLPQQYRGDVIFISTARAPSSERFLAQVADWTRDFAPALVVFVYGAPGDHTWWEQFADPPRQLGQAIAQAAARPVGLLWSDASLARLAPAAVLSPPDWQLVWNDEFDGPDGSPPDATRWTVENSGGWGNQELEYYSDRLENVRQEGGELVISARAEQFRGWSYTSARLQTRGKGDWRYGRFEVRAKIPFGHGIWPAIWMMPSENKYGPWPHGGELDLMESRGWEPDMIFTTAHWETLSGEHQQSSNQVYLPDGAYWADDYHTFTLEWQPGDLRWYVDGELQLVVQRGAPYDEKFYMILNIAVGGEWPGAPDETTVFPQEMRVDYVRVYQRP